MSERELMAADAREQALYARLEALGIASKTYEHAPVFTVEEAQALRGALAGTHTKNLFLKDKRDRLWLIVLREETRPDLNKLAKELGAGRFSFAAADLLIATLGVPPGSVTPFAAMNDEKAVVQVVLEKAMTEEPLLNFHPLRNDRTTTISNDDLVRFLDASGHPPRVMPLPERAS